MTKELLKLLIAHKGVRSFCIAPGARAAPLLEALAFIPSNKSRSFPETLFFFDERSASFFALGRSRRDQRPAAVVTTSGTATAALLPAVIESCYSSLPLILLTSDRPKREREAGAPQTLKAPNAIFTNYTALSLDISFQDLLFFSSTVFRKIQKGFARCPPPLPLALKRNLKKLSGGEVEKMGPSERKPPHQHLL